MFLNDRARRDRDALQQLSVTKKHDTCIKNAGCKKKNSKKGKKKIEREEKITKPFTQLWPNIAESGIP